MEKGIEHKGVIKEVNNNTINVVVLSVSACAECHSKGACTLADVQEKIIEVKRPEWDHKVGQEVMVAMEQSMGFWAVFYGYLLPFVVLMVSLFVVYEITHDQGMAGLLSIGLLIPYFLVLYLLRGYLKKKFIFTVKQF